ncbi:histamine H3 receptor-like [Rhinatrema bivittatum]|uniref:histamine H3 receptor-like n=1 Tax=Rhinatrema bivittatum TaxID=194408 RepID=UPI00112A62D1|nr:histamine H3 receptor-like [Rhinatrema bivittatum]
MSIHLRTNSVATEADHNFSSLDSPISPGNFRIVQSVVMVLMTAVTGSGNAFVILSFVIEKNLRSQSNYFLLNLAICDFFVGMFSLPLHLTYVIYERWILGRHICKLWLVIDYLTCQSSVYNIVLISYDRFMAVTRAVAYRAQQNRIKSAVIKMIVVWFLAFLVYGPAIIGWEYFVGYSNVPDGDCNPEFLYSKYFRLCTSIFDFFAPLAIIIYFNLSIYCNIRNRTVAKSHQMGRYSNGSSKNNEKRPSISLLLSPSPLSTQKKGHKEKE